MKLKVNDLLTFDDDYISSDLEGSYVHWKRGKLKQARIKSFSLEYDEASSEQWNLKAEKSPKVIDFTQILILIRDKNSFITDLAIETDRGNWISYDQIRGFPEQPNPHLPWDDEPDMNNPCDPYPPESSKKFQSKKTEGRNYETAN